MANIKVLGIAGSLRRGSYDRAALKAAQGLMPAGAVLEIAEIDGLPGFNQDEEKNPPAEVTELKAKSRGADAVLLVTAEYNYSIPGVPKSAIDWPRAPTATAPGRASRWPSWALPSVRSARRAPSIICARLGPELKRRGLLFTGIDVIGPYLTEINVTSPTGIRQVKDFGGPDIAALIWDAIETKVKDRS